ncbi:unnamed protein product [Vitrella brassicaformis CCMP3155]|uniref:FAD-binding PCMH-type domain-containing protein n=3 Tax=Vitrella brassicaformis TaxID=1169539 RepID=A0A0G4FL06_VITBC|nr:unnamed protein product [Vitrella brassicaformis CCMP3155]|eukprot:CEM14658.1 unnamed protein product [Vitrella brassicaformis CCMP3155]
MPACMEAAGALAFTLDGQKVVVKAADVDPSLPLASFLRSHLGCHNVKVACGEGGCGACTVLLERQDPSTKAIERHTALSCIKPLPSVHGWNVTTAKGLKDRSGALHKRMETLNAAQCGYCTPGFVVSLYDTLTSAGGDLTTDRLKGELDGNLCRCTGYRSILDVCKSFCTDAPAHLRPTTPDIEDAIPPCKWPTPVPQPLPSTPPPLLKNASLTWHTPSSLAELHSIFRSLRQDGKVRLVGHNTSVCWQEKAKEEECVISLERVEELAGIHVTERAIRVGGQATISELISVIDKEATKTATYAALSAHLRHTGSKQLRNEGTVAGNLMLVKTMAFPSDIAPLLLAWGCRIEYIDLDAPTPSAAQTQMVDLEAFLVADAPKMALIVAIVLDKQNEGAFFRSYRTAMRKHYAHATANAAFWCEFSPSSSGVVSAVRLVAGAVSDRPQRARQTEAFLLEQGLTNKTVTRAIEMLTEEVTIGASSHDSESYRKSLLAGYLYRFLLECINRHDNTRTSTPSPSSTSTHSTTTADTGHLNGTTHTDTDTDPDTDIDREGGGARIWQPLAKPDNERLVTGDAKYTGDVAMDKRALYGAYVTSEHAKATLLRVDGSEAMRVDGVVDIVTSEDFTLNRMINTVTAWDTNLLESVVPIGGQSRFVGQPVALVLAATEDTARKAAHVVKVEWADIQTPVVTIAQAMAAKREYKKMFEGRKGDIAPFEAVFSSRGTADLQVVKGKVDCGSQLHFYLEPQVAVACPDEDGRMTVHTATQGPQYVHENVALALGLPQHKVDVRLRRLGGGFGGKSTGSVPVAIMAAVAARKAGRPVHVSPTRHQDAAMTGGREEIELDYEAAFDRSGRIHAIRASVHVNCGCAGNLAYMCGKYIAEFLEQAYELQNFYLLSKLWITDLPMRMPVRAPGGLPAALAIETILDHIASSLSLDQADVRRANHLTETSLTSAMYVNGEMAAAPRQLTVPVQIARIHDEVCASSEWGRRVAEVAAFNKAHRWRKRGLGLMGLRFPRPLFASNAVINVHVDGTVLLHHEGVEMGQGLHVKVIQVACDTLGTRLFGYPLPASLVRSADFATEFMPNPWLTAASSTSERMCFAMQDAANRMAEKLMPFVNQESADGQVAERWKEVILAANGAKVNLQQQGEWRPSSGNVIDFYDTYGGTVAEVEIDVLTGEHSVRAFHMSYDCGKSINPLVDIGQAEGAAIMGQGFCTSEQVTWDATGRLINDGTWMYKPPLAPDMPTDFRVHLLDNSAFPGGFASSKATGEPPLLGSVSIFLAIQQAIRSARSDAGEEGFFTLSTPATCAKIQQSCGTKIEDMTVEAAKRGE